MKSQKFGAVKRAPTLLKYDIGASNEDGQSLRIRHSASAQLVASGKDNLLSFRMAVGGRATSASTYRAEAARSSPAVHRRARGGPPTRQEGEGRVAGGASSSSSAGLAAGRGRGDLLSRINSARATGVLDGGSSFPLVGTTPGVRVFRRGVVGQEEHPHCSHSREARSSAGVMPSEHARQTDEFFHKLIRFQDHTKSSASKTTRRRHPFCAEESAFEGVVKRVGAGRHSRHLLRPLLDRGLLKGRAFDGFVGEARFRLSAVRCNKVKRLSW